MSLDVSVFSKHNYAYNHIGDSASTMYSHSMLYTGAI